MAKKVILFLKRAWLDLLKIVLETKAWQPCKSANEDVPFMLDLLLPCRSF